MGKPVSVDPSKANATHEQEFVRLHRVLKILGLIQGRAGWTAGKLAKECGVAERTVYRDIQLLEAAGVPVYVDEEPIGYRVNGDYFMKPVEMTLDEALAVVALGEQIGRDEQVPYTQAAVRAVAKIRGQLPGKLRKELESLDDHLVIRLARGSVERQSQDVYAKVRTAIARRRCLRCVYESSAKRFTKRFVFRPYQLWFDQRAWYVIGLHGGHEQVRCLKLNRFVQIEETDISFEMPRDFSVKKHLGNAWRMIRGEKSYDVELVFDAKFAENVADTHWHDTQEIDWNENGSATFRCRVDGLDEIVWWVLARGPYCTVVKPAELRERVHRLARETARIYESRD